jgi:hypothetical protein
MQQQFAVTPRASLDPCPRLLQHIKMFLIRKVLVSDNQKHYEFLLNWFAWLVQQPEQKTGVIVVFASDQGTGKSTLVNVLQKIFGVRCLQMTNSQHLITQLGAYLDNRVLIVLNESTWVEDQLHEELLEGSITDDDESLTEESDEIKSMTTSRNIIFVSNQPWCSPAASGDRFFVPVVSNERIGDHQYFQQLHKEIDDGGVEEFLYFLMNRQIPIEWKLSTYPASSEDQAQGNRLLH